MSKKKKQKENSSKTPLSSRWLKRNLTDLQTMTRNTFNHLVISCCLLTSELRLIRVFVFLFLCAKSCAPPTSRLWSTINWISCIWISSWKDCPLHYPLAILRAAAAKMTTCGLKIKISHTAVWLWFVKKMLQSQRHSIFSFERVRRLPRAEQTMSWHLILNHTTLFT